MTNKNILTSADGKTILKQLKDMPGLYERYQTPDKKWNGRLKNFLTGKSSLPLTYDPFFKFIFNPDLHSDRLSHFISSLLGMTVQVIEVLSSEDTLMDRELDQALKDKESALARAAELERLLTEKNNFLPILVKNCLTIKQRSRPCPHCVAGTASGFILIIFLLIFFECMIIHLFFI